MYSWYGKINCTEFETVKRREKCIKYNFELKYKIIFIIELSISDVNAKWK